MSKIATRQAAAVTAQPAIDHPSPQIPPENISQCEICTGKIFWESIYRDGVLRCKDCEPAPGEEFIWEWIGLNPMTGEMRRLPSLHRAQQSAAAGGGSTPDHPTLVVDPGCVDSRGDAGDGDASDGQGEATLCSSDQAGELATTTDHHPTLVDLSDLLVVEGRMLDGRRFYARRGWDNPRSPWYSQRLCMAVGLAMAADSEGGGWVDGWEAADRLLDQGQDELRSLLIDSPREMKRITEAGAGNTDFLNTPTTKDRRHV